MTILFASTPEGITIYDKSMIDPQTNDYRKIGYISIGGNTTYINKRISHNTKEQIETYAAEIRLKFQERFEKMDIFSQYYTILDNIPMNKKGIIALRSLAKNAKAVKDKLPKLRKMYYNIA
jgi:hypothetical protein